MALTKIGATLGGSADIITVTQTSHGFVSNDRGKAVKMTNNSGTPRYMLATADSTTNADAVAIIIAVPDGNTISLALSGRITVDACVPNEAAGTVLFLPTASTGGTAMGQNNSGHLTSTEPSGNNQVSKPMAVITIANSEMIMLAYRGEVISTAGVSIADGTVTNAKLTNMAANTVKVRDANSSGDPSDKAVADTQILIGDGTGFTAAALSGDVTMANDGTVTIANNAVENAMMADDSIGVAELNTTAGTASNSTFLRGDMQWAAAGGALSTKRINTSWNISSGSDPQSITGAGFTPTKVEIIASTGTTSGGSSIGHSDEDNSDFCTSLQSNGYYGARNGNIVYISNGTWSLSASCTITSDGCSLDWASGGSSGWETVSLSIMFSR